MYISLVFRELVSLLFTFQGCCGEYARRTSTMLAKALICMAATLQMANLKGKFFLIETAGENEENGESVGEDFQEDASISEAGEKNKY